MVDANHHVERRVVALVASGNGSAIREFLDIAESSIWPVIVTLVGERAAEKTFLNVIAALKANGYARLKPYDGRSRLSTFLTLLSRDLLAENIARAFSLEPDKAWRVFDRLFGRDIRQRIRRRFPRADEARQMDLYQDVTIKLLEQNFRRIRAFTGRGSFSGYILVTVDRILIDILRQEAPRRRLPAEVLRMSPLHQAVFTATAWHGVPCDIGRVMVAVSGAIKPEPSPDQVGAALNELAGVIAATRGAGSKLQEISLDANLGEHAAPIIVDPSATVEEALLEQEEEQARDRLIEAMKREMASLSDQERFCLQTVLQASDSLPPREISRQMALPVDEVYKLRQRVLRWMKQIASDVEKKARTVRLIKEGVRLA